MPRHGSDDGAWSGSSGRSRQYPTRDDRSRSATCPAGGVAARMPRLFRAIGEGRVEAGFVLGEKAIAGRRVRPTTVAKVVRDAAAPIDIREVLGPPTPSTPTDRAALPDVDARVTDGKPPKSARPAAPRHRPRRGGPLGTRE